MHHTSERRRKVFGIGLSMAVHGLAFWGLERLPEVELEPIRVATVDFDVVRESAKPPQKPEPDPPKPEPEPPNDSNAEQPAPTQPTAHHAPAAASPRTTTEPRASDDLPPGPIDLGTLTASDLGAPGGDGVPVGTPGGGGGGRLRVPPGIKRPEPQSPRAPVRPAAPSYVAAKDLQRPPRAPGLDGTLARYYPPSARAAGISGEARVRVAVDASGQARVLGILAESYAGFGSACQRTVQGSRWSAPLDKDGRAVATTLIYRCRFRVDR